MRNLLSVFLILIFFRPVTAQSPKLQITQVAKDCYVYTTYHNLDGQPFPSNSMYLVTSAGAVMMDTPWDSTQFQPLLDTIAARHHVPVVLCIATHFHSDRTAGLAFLNSKGIPTYSSKATWNLCQERHEPQAAHFFMGDTAFVVGNHRFEAWYPGEGHTKDNIVIWLNREKILYGGCFVKSTDNNSIGNIADANLGEWSHSVQRLMKKYPHPATVIPGHFGWQQAGALQHTLQLVQQQQKNSNIIRSKT